MELDVSTCIFSDLVDKKTGERSKGRQQFLIENGLRPEAKQTIHGVKYTASYLDGTNEVDCVEVYVDQICIAAHYHFPDEVEEAIISLLTEELMLLVCSQESKKRFHTDVWLSDWLKISVIDEVLEAVFQRSFGREIRNRSVGPRVLRHLRR